MSRNSAREAVHTACKYMKRSSTSAVIRETQVKTKMRQQNVKHQKTKFTSVGNADQQNCAWPMRVSSPWPRRAGLRLGKINGKLRAAARTGGGERGESLQKDLQGLALLM